MNEQQNIEWKSEWKEDILKEICGFANAKGGTVYIGVDNKGNITGCPNSRKLLADIPVFCKSRLGIIPDVDLLENDGKQYIKITINSYPIAISFNGIYYYRSGSTKQILSGIQLESFILSKRGATWDNLPLPSFHISDIDEKALKQFVSYAERKGRIDSSLLSENTETILKRLHLYNDRYLNNAAMLLFAKDPEQ